MTPKKRLRKPPTTMRLPDDLRLRLIEIAADAGMNFNALLVMALWQFVGKRIAQVASTDRKALSASLGTLGALTTALRQLVKLGLLDIFPSLENDLSLTFLKIRETCDAIISALGRPSDPA